MLSEKNPDVTPIRRQARKSDIFAIQFPHPVSQSNKTKIKVSTIGPSHPRCKCTTDSGADGVQFRLRLSRVSETSIRQM